MFRRRTRTYERRNSLNSGLSTPSAASAAAAASYGRQTGAMLSSSAAAEALRRHSLDQEGADAISSFPRGNGVAGYSVGTRRANSLTSGPSRAYQRAVAASGLNRQPSSTVRPYVHASPRRANSLNRSNSLTRSHTVVNRDREGRTMSLTTTTVRQLGGFELVSTHETPMGGVRQVSSSGSLRRPGYADSLHSFDSELARIPENDTLYEAPIQEEINEYSDSDETPRKTAITSAPSKKSALRSESTLEHRPSKVSFGDTTKEFVYDSYDFSEEPSPPTKKPDVAAAAAASRSRTIQPHQKQANSEASRIKPQATVVRAPVQQPVYPRRWTADRHSRATTAGIENDYDSDSIYSDAADPVESGVMEPSPVKPPKKSSLRPRMAFSSDIESQEEQSQAKLRAQAVGLAQGVYARLGDDNASVKSDSSFKREHGGRSTRNGKSGGESKSGAPRMIGTLRPNGIGPEARKNSLSSHSRVAAPTDSIPQLGASFRSYSLRNTERPDPSALLAGESPTMQQGVVTGGGFRSRIAESDSEDEGQTFFSKGRSTKNGGGHKEKLTLRDVFSPNTPASVLLGHRASSEQLPRSSKPKKQGLFKRLFRKN